MPVYATSVKVQELLRQEDGQPFTADELARIADLLPFVSLHIEHATGATFQNPAPAASGRDVRGEGGRMLFLPMGVRSVASIVEEPTWDGSAWTGGVALTTSQYRLTSQVANGAYRTLTRTDGGWLDGGLYLISAVWEDTYGTVPADITYIANYLASEVFKAQQASPHGLIGPDQSLVPIRKALALPEVRAVIDFYRVGPVMLAV